MSGSDYVLGLLTIVTGLAISDMVVSLHSLLMNRRHVVWDWLALTSAAFVLLMIVGSWRLSFLSARNFSVGPPIWVFLIVMALTICIYLAARAVLPDRVDVGTTVDLKAHYDFVNRYLWSAILAFYGLFVLLNVAGFLMFGGVEFPAIVLQSAISLVPLLALVIWPVRKVHRWIVPLLFIWLCVRLLPARLLAL